MKKGLSILLVAAALFGFYGGAVNLNDVLACKDYWEEAGEKSTADMNKLEDGLNQLKENEQAYLDGLDQVAEGEQALADGEAQYAEGLADYAAAPGKLAAGEKKLAAGQAAYNQGQKDLAAGQSTLDQAKSMLKQLQDGIKQLSDQETGYPAWREGITQVSESEALNEAAEPFRTNGSLDANKINPKLEETKALKESLEPYKKQYEDLAGLKDQIKDAPAVPASSIPDSVKQALTAMGKSEMGGMPGYYSVADVTAAADYLQDQINAGVKAKAGLPAEAPVTVLDLYQQASDGVTSLTNLKKLADGKTQMQSQLLPLLNKVKDNEQFVEKLGGETAVKQLLGGLNGTDLQFRAAMDQVMAAAPGLVDTLKQAIASGEKELAAGKAKLAAGAKELAAGKAELAQGYADYAAAPGKLADAEQQLADGRKQLEDGKAQLAQYEDGEQQIRDGLATLMATEADLDLESILDRRGGDDDFDNGDNHLEIEEGLEAVETGRGYQAEDGVLISDEIMGRAIGTAGILGAGLLAIIAAILSFLKKNKGAGVFAILAALAAAYGAFTGTNAGTYFSDIAGSTAGNAGWVAAGIIGVIALVHAIAHFTAKKEA